MTQVAPGPPHAQGAAPPPGVLGLSRAGGTTLAPDVLLALETVDPRTGVRVRRVVVRDISDDSPTREPREELIAASDALLRANPGWRAPEVLHGDLVLRNQVSRWLYAVPALREWRRELVPSAAALYPLQRPGAGRLPSGGEVDEAARGFFVDGLDAVGIRTRALLMGDVARRCTTAHLAAGDRRPLSWVSLACGAAVPVLDALQGFEGAGVHLSLVDLDAQALRFAARLARAQGLVEGADFSLLRRDLVRSAVARAELVQELGEGRASLVEALGIFEYFSDASCVRLLRNAHRLLRPGGVLVVANMLSDRRHMAFHRRGVGWPRTVPRSVDRLVDLVHRAGLPLDRTTVSIPQDGVYAVVAITR